MASTERRLTKGGDDDSVFDPDKSIEVKAQYKPDADGDGFIGDVMPSHKRHPTPHGEYEGDDDEDPVNRSKAAQHDGSMTQLHGSTVFIDGPVDDRRESLVAPEEDSVLSRIVSGARLGAEEEPTAVQ